MDRAAEKGVYERAIGKILRFINRYLAGVAMNGGFMNRKDEFEQLKTEYKSIKVPQKGKEHMQEMIDKAKADKRRISRRKLIRNWIIAAAAALVIVILPNTNEAVANSMKNLPVIGNIFKVITVREYEHKDKNTEIMAKVPKVEYAGDKESSINKQAVEELNKSTEKYVSLLIRRFKKDMEDSGYGALDISYRKITDTDKWFTLAFDATEVQASGYEFHKYYHLDKKAGKIVQLKDMFKEDADYVTLISKEIKRQMKEQMKNSEKTYFISANNISDGFEKISKNQNFYFDDNGDMVIVFNEYEVGPGSIGAPQFTIPKEVISSILRLGY